MVDFSSAARSPRGSTSLARYGGSIQKRQAQNPAPRSKSWIGKIQSTTERGTTLCRDFGGGGGSRTGSAGIGAGIGRRNKSSGDMRATSSTRGKRARLFSFYADKRIAATRPKGLAMHRPRRVTV